MNKIVKKSSSFEISLRVADNRAGKVVALPTSKAARELTSRGVLAVTGGPEIANDPQPE